MALINTHIMIQKKMWMVRAGEDAFLIDDFRDKGIIAIGWNDIGDLNKIKNLEDIKRALAKKYPENNTAQINMQASQISKFKSDFQKGDKVVSYDPVARIYLIGEIISDYEYNTQLTEYYHIRKVNWLGNVSRDTLSTETKNTLGAISTIFSIGEEAQEEILSFSDNKKAEIKEIVKLEEEELELYKENIINRAHEFIKDMILKLDWEDMQRLIAGILRGMGYKTRISSSGSDRSRDVTASPDGLGLEDPNIITEVKHRKGQMGAPEVRTFIGGLRSGMKGIYVSTGGFSKEAQYEAERSPIPISLINADLLVKLIVENYEKFDVETRILIPLTKIYWPE